MFTLTRLILILTAVTVALMAGLFYTWSISVTPGLSRLPDSVYLQSFQAMNRAILNPLFFVCFMGAAILLPLSAWLCYKSPPEPRFWCLLGAAICYLAGVIGITMLGNVPLNDKIDTFSISSASLKELTAQRAAFESAWNRLNNIRTVMAILSLVFTLVSFLFPEDRRLS